MTDFPSYPDNAALRKVLEQARDFIDPDRDPPRINNRKLVMKINAVLSRVDAQTVQVPETISVTEFADWFYENGHEFVISDEEDVARGILDSFDVRPKRRSPEVTSTMRRGPCEVCGQPADLCMSSLSRSKTWICVMCDPDSPTVDASREDGK